MTQSWRGRRLVREPQGFILLFADDVGIFMLSVCTEAVHSQYELQRFFANVFQLLSVLHDSTV